METGGLLILISAETFQEAPLDVVCFMHIHIMYKYKVTFSLSTIYIGSSIYVFTYNLLYGILSLVLKRKIHIDIYKKNISYSSGA